MNNFLKLFQRMSSPINWTLAQKVVVTSMISLFFIIGWALLGHYLLRNPGITVW